MNAEMNIIDTYPTQLKVKSLIDRFYGQSKVSGYGEMLRWLDDAVVHRIMLDAERCLNETASDPEVSEDGSYTEMAGLHISGNAYRDVADRVYGMLSQKAVQQVMSAISPEAAAVIAATLICTNSEFSVMGAFNVDFTSAWVASHDKADVDTFYAVCK